MSHFLILCLLLNPFSFITMSAINTKANVGKVDTVNKVNNNAVKQTKELITIGASYPKVSGLSDKKFEAEVNQSLEKKTKDFIEEIDAMATRDKEFIRTSDTNIKYECYVNYECYINGTILSIVVDYYSYTGGAHGLTYREAINIDIKNNSYLSLKDLFKDKENYKEHVVNAIHEKMEEEPEKYFSTEVSSIENFNEKNFYVKDNKLVVFFQIYDIAPYVSGMPEFVIPR